MTGRQDDSGRVPAQGLARRAVIYFRMMGPYQLARVNAAAERVPVTGIEGARRSLVYAWEPRDGDTRFERHVLFDSALEKQSAQAIVAATEAALHAADPDIVCITGWSHSEALTMLRWARRRRRHAILLSESTEHDHDRTRIREAVKRRLVGLCDAALVGGQPQRAYAERLGLPGDRIFLGYDAVDNDHFRLGADAARIDDAARRAALGLPERYFFVSCRFIEKKNLVRLIEAYAMYLAAARNETWDLVIAGDGEQRAALEALVRARALAPRVHFLGFRQYDDLPTLYGLAGGFVHVSTVEQWGLVVNEACAAGLPVIVSDRCGCVEDLVEPGANGWRVDPFDTGAIASALGELASPDTDRAAMAARGREIVSRYGPSRFGEGLAEAIAAARRSPPRGLGWFDDWLLRTLAARNTSDTS